MAKLSVLPIPMHNYVLGKMVLASKTSGGIDLPDGVQVDDINKMEIVAVGPGRRGFSGEIEPVDLEVGDVALCLVRDDALPPIQFEYEGERYSLITSAELVAKLPPE